MPGELEHFYLDIRGLRLHVVAAGPDDGPLVILLHGFPEFWYGWRHQIGPLAEAGFRVVAPDQRGYNDSDKPAGITAYSLDELAADVAAIADAFGYETFHLAGHDWGGLVAWWTTLRYPLRVDRLIALNAPHPIAARRYIKRHARQALRSWYVLFFRIPRLPEWLLSRAGYAALRVTLKGSFARDLFSTEEIRRYREAWAKPGALHAMINWYRAFRGFRTHRTGLTVRAPTLILWGDGDRFLEFGLAEASRSFCRNARLVRLEGISHWVQHEAAERVNEEMIEFFSGRMAR